MILNTFWGYMAKKTKKVDAIIQARLTSTRFPGKVNKMLGGKTILARVIENVQKSRLVDRIILAIPDTQENMDLVQYEEMYDVKIFAGSENNVLDRFIQAGEFYDAEHILRVCGDAPFLPSWLIDHAIETWNPDEHGYLRTSGMASGQNVELVTLDILKSIKDPSYAESEHVTLALYKPADVARAIMDIDSLSIDTQEDLESMQKMVKHYD